MTNVEQPPKKGEDLGLHYSVQCPGYWPYYRGPLFFSVEATNNSLAKAGLEAASAFNFSLDHMKIGKGPVHDADSGIFAISAHFYARRPPRPRPLNAISIA